MVVHANTISQRDMEKYRKIFEENEVISYGDYLRMEAEKRGWTAHCMEYLLAVGKRILVSLRRGKGR